MKIKVVVADHHPLMLLGIERALQATHDVEVVGKGPPTAALLRLALGGRADVVLLGLDAPAGPAMMWLSELGRHSRLKVVVMSDSRDPETIARLLAGGASAYVVRSVGDGEIASAIRQAVQGTVFHAPAAATGEPYDETGLTPRERSILRAIATGQPTKIISRDFGLAERTVKFHLGNIYRKLGVSNRAGAVRYAYENHLAA